MLEGKRSLSPFIIPGGSEKEPSRALNDVDLIALGLAQLVIVARLSTWRGVGAEASRFAAFRRRYSPLLRGRDTVCEVEEAKVLVPLPSPSW